ncbi:MAG: ISNCY family transposase [Acidobacteriota bacterium]
MAEETVTLTKRNAERLRVLHQVMDGLITQVYASQLLSISDRQVRTLLGRVREEGVKGLIHRGRGRPSPRKMSEAMADRIAAIIRTRYPDFSPLLASEKLRERHRIEVSREKLRQVMMAKGLWKRRRFRKAAHFWRERRHRLGEMVQMDGSHHDWLEGRGPRLVLMGYVDDATGRFYGRFYDHEGVYPAMDSLRCYIELYGLPLAIYLDKHSTYKTTRQADMDELLKDKQQAETQFERALGELGIQTIHAHSPQAKGRVERVFRTLQDRLVKEMRLAGIKTLDGANRFLQRYCDVHNRRRTTEAREPGDLHRPLPKSVVLNDVLCIKGFRTVNEGYLVKWRGRTFVLDKPSLTLRQQKLVVLERFDGRLALRHKGRDLAYREVWEPKRPAPKPVVVKIRPKPPKYNPPAAHPWRHQLFGNGQPL